MSNNTIPRCHEEPSLRFGDQLNRSLGGYGYEVTSVKPLLATVFEQFEDDFRFRGVERTESREQ